MNLAETVCSGRLLCTVLVDESRFRLQRGYESVLKRFPSSFSFADGHAPTRFTLHSHPESAMHYHRRYGRRAGYVDDGGCAS